MLQICQITISVLCLLAMVNTQVNLPESCVNDGGECIQISKCPYAIDYIKDKRNHIVLKNITCGFDNFDPKVCCKLQKTEDSKQFHSQTSTIVPQNGAYYPTPILPAMTQPPKQLIPTSTIPTHIYNNTSTKGFIASNVNKVSDDANNSSVKQENNVANGLNQEIIGEASSHGPQINSGNIFIQENARPTNNFLPQRDVIGGSNLKEVLNETINSNNNSLLPTHLPDNNVCGTVEIFDRIYGGDITDIQEFPWIARLKYRQGETNHTAYLCGGSLISDRYVLTAAHCVNTSTHTLLEVRLGEWNSEEERDCDMQNNCNDQPEDIVVEKRIVHPTYSIKSRFIFEDIALLRLQRAVKFTKFIKPICLPSTPAIADQDINYDIPYWASGWGKTEYGSDPAIKHKVSLKAVEWEICRASYNNFNISDDLASRVICAGGRKGEDTCQGDSGGPLMRKVSHGYNENWYLFGIVSLGRSCGQAGVPALYTRVSAYMDWIKSELRN